MFLITSSYLTGNKTDENILFAGEWCVPFVCKNVNQKYNIFNYHWSDRGKLRKDLEYLETVYEKYLINISSNLNHMHGVSYSIREWRIIIGPWLQDFIELLFDYYEVILEIDKSNSISNTCIVNYNIYDQIPQDITSFQHAYSSGWYIHVIMSEIIKRNSSIKYTTIKQKSHPIISRNLVSTGEDTVIHKIKRFIKYIFSMLYSSMLIPGRMKRIAFVSSYFSGGDLKVIQKKLNQFPFSYLFDPVPLSKMANIKLREKFNIEVMPSNNFEKLLEEMIPIQMPIAYLENFKSYRTYAKLFFPKKVSAIFTSNSYYFNEAFKSWAAKQVHDGCRMLISQHGGGMSTALWNHTLVHQIKISDIFYTWGWGNNRDTLKVMPSTKLSDTKKKISYIKNKKILCVINSDIVNYMHTQTSIPLNSDFKDYISVVLKILPSLRDEVKKEFKYRLYHTSYNRYTWGIGNEIDRVGMSSYVDTNGDFYKSINNCNLAIITYHPNNTAFETLSANYPTLLFWENKYFEHDKNADKFYNILSDVGIYHNSLESLVLHLNKIYEDIDAWWLSNDVQNAVALFCNEYAYTSEEYLTDWVKEINRVFKAKSCKQVTG